MATRSLSWSSPFSIEFKAATSRNHGKTCVVFNARLDDEMWGAFVHWLQSEKWIYNIQWSSIYATANCQLDCLPIHTQLENTDSIHLMGKSCVCKASSTTQATFKNQASRTQTQLSHPSLIHHFEVCKIDHKGPGSMTCWYCWWKNSGDHQLRLVSYPIIYRVLYIPGGLLGFLPSTVFPKFSEFTPKKGQQTTNQRSINQSPPNISSYPKNKHLTDQQGKEPFRELRWFLPTEVGNSELSYVP